MSTTINTFPPLHAFDSPRSWFMALIVLLHVGFFWALNNGFSLSRIILPPPQTVVDFIKDEPRPEPAPSDPIVDASRVVSYPYVPPVPAPPTPQYAPEETPTGSGTPNPLPPISRNTPIPQPTIIAPAIPSAGLSEPIYPASEIRAENEGTVLLSVQVLENGRVREVRLLQSSGFAKLDASALREARKWRFIPGKQDGVPVVLWKEVPITFKLTDRDKNR